MTYRDKWPNEKLIRVIEDCGCNLSEVSLITKVPGRTLRHWIANDRNLREYINEKRVAVRLAKSLQSARDFNNAANKQFREHARVDNTIEILLEEYIKLIKKHNLSKLTKKWEAPEVPPEAELILHVTDLHLNERVQEKNNRFDFTIAGKRLMLLADNAIMYGKLHGITTIYLLMTGDMFNSDRRLEEKQVNATNRTKACLLGEDIFQLMILYLNQAGFNVVCGYVSGNEGRVDLERGWDDEAATHNYDFMLGAHLRRLFAGSEGVTFLEGDNTEKLVNVAGQTVLMLHGDNAIGKEPTDGIAKTIGRYATDHHVNVDFVICGHFHQAYVSDMFSRGASLVGGNAYSSKALNLAGRASQNVHILFKNGSRNSIKVDLQNTKGVEGFNIQKQLEAYNVKSIAKTRKKRTIHTVEVIC